MINHGNPINLGWWLGGYLSCSDPYSTQWTWGLEVLSVEVPWIKQQQYNPWRIHGAGILMLTWLGYIDDKCYIVTIYSSTIDPSWVKKVTNLPDLPQTKHPVTSAPKRSRIWRRLMRAASSLTISSMRPTPPDTNISQTVVLQEASGSGDCWHGDENQHLWGRWSVIISILDVDRIADMRI